MRNIPLLLMALTLLIACSPQPPATMAPAAAVSSPAAASELAAPTSLQSAHGATAGTATPAALSGSGPLAADISTPAPPQVTVIAQTAAVEPALPTAGPPAISQLTQGGCCVQPFWSPDSRQVLFIDRPDPRSPSGIWGVPVSGGQPSLWTERLGLYSADLSLRAFPSRGTTVVERLADNQRWVIDNGGRSVSFSPDSSLVAWTAGQAGPPFDTAVRQLWVSQADGTQARRVLGNLVGGGFSGWLPDGRMLINTRLQAPESGQVISVLSLPDEPGVSPEPFELARGERLRSLSVSTNGSWLAYVVTFSDDAGQSGLRLVNTTTGQQRRIDTFGAYRWRDDEHLLLVPLDLNHPQHSLLQFSASSGEVSVLMEPDQPAFKIANGDWSVSPDGQWVVFLSANDQNLWLIDLP